MEPSHERKDLYRGLRRLMRPTGILPRERTESILPFGTIISTFTPIHPRGTRSVCGTLRIGDGSLDTLHKNMKFDMGVGVRGMVKGLVVRIDVAGSSESYGVSIMVSQPFQW